MVLKKLLENPPRKRAKHEDNQEHRPPGSNPGYNTLDDFTFTIKAEGHNRDEGVALDDKTAANTLKVTAQKDDSATMVTSSVVDGTVTLTIKNKKGSNLSLTGLNGVTFT